MRSAKIISLVLILIAFGCATVQAQQSTGKYTDYDRGYYYYFYNKYDSAFPILTRYILSSNNRLYKGKAFLHLGEMQWSMGDLFGAEENLLNAIHVLNPKKKEQRTNMGYAYNILGNVSLDLKAYQQAINYYNESISNLKGDDFILEVMNGKATVYQKMDNYPAAIAIYDSILVMRPSNQLLVARAIDNRAMTRWLQDSTYPALAELHAALKIRTDSQYHMPLNASYAHLSDYYAKTRKDSALWYAERMLEKARAAQSREDMLEAMDKLIRFNSNPVIKDHWYTSYKKLNDSLQLSKDTTRSRFALIRYDYQKSKADNLLLQQHITKQQILMYGLTIVAFAIIAGFAVWYRKRRQRIKLETENAIRNERLKTSQKVHDVVANGLYGIMNELEHSPTLEREPMISKIEGLYEKSRNISYEDFSESNTVNYDRQVHELLTAFANEKTKIVIVGNQSSFWNKLTPHQKQDLQLVLNEMMVNMKKHSQAKNVSVIFKEDNNKGFITYKDDGIGYSTDQQFGHGLKSTVNRINSLNGDINFGKGGEAGVTIEISFPLESSNS